MALDENVGLVRDLQAAGQNMARLAAYMTMGVMPSRENLARAQAWFQGSSEQLEPALQSAEVEQARSRARMSLRG